MPDLCPLAGTCLSAALTRRRRNGSSCAVNLQLTPASGDPTIPVGVRVRNQVGGGMKTDDDEHPQGLFDGLMMRRLPAAT